MAVGKGKALMGPMAQRKKTDMRLPPELLGHLEDISVALGVPMNALFCVSASFLIVQLSPLLPGMKRAQILAELERMLQRLFREARKSM